MWNKHLLLGFCIVALLLAVPLSSATLYNCDTCDSCNVVILNVSSGDTVYLNDSISIMSGSCIVMSGVSNVTFDCQGHTITSSGFDASGIVVAASSDVNIFNCSVTGFNYGLQDYLSSFTNYSYSHANGNYYGIQISDGYGTKILSTEFNYNTYFGMDIQTSSNILLSDIVAHDNGLTGIGLAYVTGTNVIENTRSYSNAQDGFSFWNLLNSTLMNNITVDGNAVYGMVIDGGSYGNTIEHSTFTNNAGAGIAFGSTGGNTENNLIYDNVFNNSVNAFFADDTIPQVWNVAKHMADNILGGCMTGGNYWGYPNGTGFSDLCSDMNHDGICDADYVMSIANTDYFPLTHNEGIGNATLDSVTLYYSPYALVGDNVTLIAVVKSGGLPYNASQVDITLDNMTDCMTYNETLGAYEILWIPLVAGVYNISIFAETHSSNVTTFGLITVLDNFICIDVKLWTNITMPAGAEYRNEFAWVYAVRDVDAHFAGLWGRDTFECSSQGIPECFWHGKYVNGTASVCLPDDGFTGNYSLFMVGNNINFQQGIGSGVFVSECQNCKPNVIKQTMNLPLGVYHFDTGETLDLYFNPTEMAATGGLLGWLTAPLGLIVLGVVAVIFFFVVLISTGSLTAALAALVLLPTIIMIFIGVIMGGL